ncbi:N-acetylmuramoyl-L-alanine amidase [Virgibacillus halophilus]
MTNAKRFSMVGFGILLFLFIFLPAANAQSGDAYKVGTSSLVVRSAPASNSEIIGQLSQGQTVIVFKEQHGWAMTYYAGKEAWVASQFLVADSQQSTDSGETVHKPSNDYIAVAADGVNLRTGPGTNHQVIGSALHGDTYKLTGTKGDWHRIVLGDGTTAWIAAWLTSPTNVHQTTRQTKATNTSQSNGTQTKRASLAGYNIVLDAGHGGKDPGALGLDGLREKDLTLSTANRVRDVLQSEGATVVATRSGDEFLSLDKRVQISNSYKTDAFISLHFNAYPTMTVRGVSTHYYSNGGNDMALAQSIQTALMQHVNMPNRGIHQSDYHVLRTNSDLAVLVELGFITNQYDAGNIQTNQYQTDVANAIADGLKTYFN